MKSPDSSHPKEKAKAAGERPVGPEAEKLPEKQKKLLNLKEESQHAIGEEKLAVDQEVQDEGRKS